MDVIYASEAAQILGLSRATLQRMADDKRLPADGFTDSGARYWLRTTILNHLSGKPSRTRYVYVESSCIETLKAPEQGFRSLVTGKVEPLTLTAETPARCLVEICSVMTGLGRTSALGIGMSFTRHPLFGSLAMYALELGVAIILTPDE